MTPRVLCRLAHGGRGKLTGMCVQRVLGAGGHQMRLVRVVAQRHRQVRVHLAEKGTGIRAHFEAVRWGGSEKSKSNMGNSGENKHTFDIIEAKKHKMLLQRYRKIKILSNTAPKKDCR